MKKIVIAFAFVMLFPSIGQAQEADSRLATYRALLSEANDRIVGLSAQGAALEAKVKELTAQKVETDKTAAPSAPDKK